jgi:hypothetical protein
MFPVTYWTPTYWTGRYWPPGGIVVRLPEPLLSVLSIGQLTALIDTTSRVAAIVAPEGVVAASLQMDDASLLGIATEQPPYAMLVREDLSAVLGPSDLAVWMPVIYVTSELIDELLEAKIDDGAIVAVTSRGD